MSPAEPAKPLDLKTQLGMANEPEVAALQNLTLPSLRNQRARGDGPPWIRAGKEVLYPIPELKKYLARKMVRPKRKPPTLIDAAARKRLSAATRRAAKTEEAQP